MIWSTDTFMQLQNIWNPPWKRRGGGIRDDHTRYVGGTMWDVTPTERDIKVVLTELGTLNELASKYKGETQDCLIGQPYYSLYVYVLKIVTVCISGGMLLAQIMAALTSHTIWYIAIYRTIGGFGGILTGFAFVTLLFAFFYKKELRWMG